MFFLSHGDALHWLTGTYADVLRRWSGSSLVMIHLLSDDRRWAHTVLGSPNAVVGARQAGDRSVDLEIRHGGILDDNENGHRLILPVASFDPAELAGWARMQMGFGAGHRAFVLSTARAVPPAEAEKLVGLGRPGPTHAIANLRQISPPAFDLAIHLAFRRFTLPVARLVQELTENRHPGAARI